MSDSVYASVAAGLSEQVRDQFPRERFHHVSETGSTNDDLLDLIRGGTAQHLDLIVADHQSKGRGRRGDRWEASPGRNLLFSIALKLEEPRSSWPRLPHLSAYVLGGAIESVLTDDSILEAKWPNDLLFHQQKLAGILVETVLAPKPFAVVGIGLNVNMRRDEFPEELQEEATSLYEMQGCESNRWFLLGEIISGFAKCHPNKLTNFSDVHEWLTKRNLLLGRRLKVKTTKGVIEGTGCGLGKDGELLIDRGNNEIEAILSAERVLFC
tara:strand:+ start:478 stop:1281 length:804 start_codon:yes stop_codon:yes gene_type:complete